MSEEQKVIDTDTMSLAEVRKLADEELAKQLAQPEAQVEKTPVPAQPKAPAPPAPPVYRREIDLGDGSGKQVFEGTSWEELADKLASAQTNASRKIREQNEELRTFKQKKQQEEEQFNADDEFVLSQEMMSRPTEAIKKAFKKMTGYDLSEFATVAERAKAWDASQVAQEEKNAQEVAGAAFVQAHPEFQMSARNIKKMARATDLLMAEGKQNGQKLDYRVLIEKAYEDLSESGLLELKDISDATAAKSEPTGAGQPRIEEPEEVVLAQRPKSSSSLTSRPRAAAAPKSEPSEDELYSMPLDKLRELANRA